MRGAKPGLPGEGKGEWGAVDPRNSRISVRRMSDSDIAAWDECVLGSAHATFFHRAGWRKIFTEIFRLHPHFLLAEREGHIVGVLPLVHQKSFIFGNALIAAAFCVEGGPLANDAETRAALDAAAIALMHRTGASYLEFRSRKASRPEWHVKRDLYATFARSLSADDNTNSLAIPRKQRAVVRKTLQGPLVSELDGTCDRFFRVYSESVRNLGTPVFAKRYFSAL